MGGCRGFTPDFWRGIVHTSQSASYQFDMSLPQGCIWQETDKKKPSPPFPIWNWFSLYGNTQSGRAGGRERCQHHHSSYCRQPSFRRKSHKCWIPPRNCSLLEMLRERMMLLNEWKTGILYILETTKRCRNYFKTPLCSCSAFLISGIVIMVYSFLAAKLFLAL